MAEQGESVTKLDTVLERVPIVDGGGRRRLSAGTLVVLTALVAIPAVRGWIFEAVSAKDISLSILLATSALLIYATGVIVELIGEVFLTRAVANATWSYIVAEQYVRQKTLPSWAKALIRIPVVLIWGSVRAIAYFATGFF